MVLPLDLEASELLSDTFEVLSCKEIKLSTMRSKPDEDIQPDEDEMAMANAVMQAAQKKLISQVCCGKRAGQYWEEFYLSVMEDLVQK